MSPMSSVVEPGSLSPSAGMRLPGTLRSSIVPKASMQIHEQRQPHSSFTRNEERRVFLKREG
jgi:hypothetical protein